MVLDPIVLVNTAKVPDGMSAKLLTLLAYGGVTAYLNINPGAGKPDTHAAQRALTQAIPAAAWSSEWCLASSQTLIDAVIQRVGRLRDQDQVELDTGVVAAAVAVHAVRWIPERWDAVPSYTGTHNTESNVSIHTALRTGAPLLITKSPDACPPETPSLYRSRAANDEFPLGAVRAVHLDLLVEALRQTFDFDEIDARVLEKIAPTGPEGPKREQP